jgi:hypothetical protein
MELVRGIFQTELKSMDKEHNLRVIELRNYLLKPGLRRAFSAYFAEHFTSSQDNLGGLVLGQFRIRGEEDKFFWIRGFVNMATRSRFLPEFYSGAVWKKFGGGANEMMLDSDDVYLLKPLNDEQIFRKNKTLKIDYYFAVDKKPDQLTGLLETEFVSFFKDSAAAETTLWLSELAENDFPRLPAFQYENLVVVITAFEDEADFRAKLEEFDATNPEFKNRLERLITKKESLTLYEI